MLKLTASEALETEWEESAPLSKSATRRREIHQGDRLFFWFVAGLAASVPLLLLFIAYFLYDASYLSLEKFGWSFLTSTTWDPVRDNFGALPVIFGTLLSSLLALFFSAPLSVGVALFICELAPKKMAKILSFFVEMLAAIPSVVYGLWGIFVLAPWLKESFEPFFIQNLGPLPVIGALFKGPAYGVGMITAGLILSIMIIPTISSISREVFLAVSREQREGALALGATRWEMMRIAVLKSSHAGVFGAVILGLGRALGETMAVTMVIGNRAQITASLFHPGQTMASVIANEYVEATSDIHLAALAEIGLILFAVTFLVNLSARFLIRSVR